MGRVETHRDAVSVSVFRHGHDKKELLDALDFTWTTNESGRLLENVWSRLDKKHSAVGSEVIAIEHMVQLRDLRRE